MGSKIRKPLGFSGHVPPFPRRTVRPQTYPLRPDTIVR